MTTKHEVRKFLPWENCDWTLTVDPGSTTGFAVADTETGELLLCGQQPPFPFQQWVHFHANRLGPALTLVCERFTISQRTLKSSRAGSYDALYIIGTLRYLCEFYTGREMPFQQPVEAMNLFTDERLKAMGWYQKAFGHANDSLRHMGLWLAHRGVIKVPVL